MHDVFVHTEECVKKCRLVLVRSMSHFRFHSHGNAFLSNVMKFVDCAVSKFFVLKSQSHLTIDKLALQNFRVCGRVTGGAKTQNLFHVVEFFHFYKS